MPDQTREKLCSDGEPAWSPESTWRSRRRSPDELEVERLRGALEVVRRVAGTLGSNQNEIIELCNRALGLSATARPEPISAAAAAAAIAGGGL